MSDPNAKDKLVIEMPDIDKPGEWAKKYAERITEAEKVLAVADTIGAKIS